MENRQPSQSAWRRLVAAARYAGLCACKMGGTARTQMEQRTCTGSSGRRGRRWSRSAYDGWSYRSCSKLPNRSHLGRPATSDLTAASMRFASASLHPPTSTRRCMVGTQIRIDCRSLDRAASQGPSGDCPQMWPLLLSFLLCAMLALLVQQLDHAACTDDCPLRARLGEFM
jgi:hypothetical protein